MNISEIIRETAENVTAGDIVVLIFGLLPFVYWLKKTGFGKDSLSDSSSRRNALPIYAPVVPIFIWFGLSSLVIYLIRGPLMDLPGWQQAFWRNAVWSLCGLAAVVVMVFMAKNYFARGLRGFGFKPEKAGKDITWGAVNLVTVWPLLFLAIMLTLLIGKLIFGAGYELSEHQELEMIQSYDKVALLVIIGFVAVVVAPLMEEMLFRGFLQTIIRSYTGQPWLSIALTSGLFAILHADVAHWPALFILSSAMGYSYEKSGSILRPIFIHALFNGMSVVAVASETFGK